MRKMGSTVLSTTVKAKNNKNQFQIILQITSLSETDLENKASGLYKSYQILKSPWQLTL